VQRHDSPFAVHDGRSLILQMPHTPEPWSLTVGKHIRITARHGPHSNAVIAGVHRIGVTRGQGVPPEIMGNAYLISAAPDLLRELQKLIQICKENGIPVENAESAVDKALHG
jgi:hypothetical protein